MASEKFQHRQALGRGIPLTTEEYEAATLLADIIEATPPGQRTARMQSHLDRVRMVVPIERAKL